MEEILRRVKEAGGEVFDPPIRYELPPNGFDVHKVFGRVELLKFYSFGRFLILEWYPEEGFHRAHAYIPSRGDTNRPLAIEFAKRKGS